MFKTGDKVRIVKLPGTGAKKHIGKTGVITHDDLVPAGMYDVKLDQPIGWLDAVLLFESEIEKVA